MSKQRKNSNKNPDGQSNNQLTKVDDAIDVIDKLDEPERSEVVERIISTSFRGPIPPPDMLAHYDQIEVGLASRIVGMAEIEQGSLIKDRETIIKFQGRDSLLGAIFSFLIVVLPLFLGVFLIISDKEVSGFINLGLGAIGAGKLFLVSDKKNGDSSEDKKNNK